jgi:hypothetical protein
MTADDTFQHDMSKFLIDLSTPFTNTHIICITFYNIANVRTHDVCLRGERNVTHNKV